PCLLASLRAQMVKGAWWHSAHFFVSFQPKLSVTRKVRPRLIASLTVGEGSAAAAPTGKTTRVTMAERRRTANLQAGSFGSKRSEAAGEEANRSILRGRQAGCQRTVRCTAGAAEQLLQRRNADRRSAVRFRG